jgi:hypothetical protein
MCHNELYHKERIYHEGQQHLTGESLEVRDELNLLRYNVRTLSCQLKTANRKIRQLDDINMSCWCEDGGSKFAAEENKEVFFPCSRPWSRL